MADPTRTVVDARGHRCPTPALRLRRALQDASTGTVIDLLADDPMARIDVPHFASAAGHQVLACREEGATLRFSVRKGSSTDVASRDRPPA